MPETRVTSTKKNKKIFTILMIIGSLLLIGGITVGVLFATGVIGVSPEPKPKPKETRVSCDYLGPTYIQGRNDAAQGIAYGLGWDNIAGKGYLCPKTSCLDTDEERRQKTGGWWCEKPKTMSCFAST
tara:strand:- start:75 stop:455 length:381 start_codon:yes stop_codon:yes gene_type:complete